MSLKKWTVQLEIELEAVENLDEYGVYDALTQVFEDGSERRGREVGIRVLATRVVRPEEEEAEAEADDVPDAVPDDDEPEVEAT